MLALKYGFAITTFFLDYLPPQNPVKFTNQIPLWFVGTCTLTKRNHELKVTWKWYFVKIIKAFVTNFDEWNVNKQLTRVLKN